MFEFQLNSLNPLLLHSSTRLLLSMCFNQLTDLLVRFNYCICCLKTFWTLKWNKNNSPFDFQQLIFFIVFTTNSMIGNKITYFVHASDNCLKNQQIIKILHYLFPFDWHRQFKGEKCDWGLGRVPTTTK